MTGAHRDIKIGENEPKPIIKKGKSERVLNVNALSPVKKGNSERVLNVNSLSLVKKGKSERLLNVNSL